MDSIFELLKIGHSHNLAIIFGILTEILPNESIVYTLKIQTEICLEKKVLGLLTFVLMEIEKLKKWFERNKRALPWRVSPTPYRVWISEVMLQQTLAPVVIPYFEKWMAVYPTVKDLAEAPMDAVIKTWEGLGYYSRARNLHAGAKMILRQHSGELPKKKDALLKIKGIGDYTAGAILSFAFKQKEAAVDGNVKRVIARLFAIEEDIDKPKTYAAIKNHVLSLLPEDKPWEAMEALIELGATVCRKKPECEGCPLQSGCQAYKLGREKEFPVKAAKIKYEKLNRTVFILQSKDKILITKGAEGKVMQDLHEFPYIETEEKGLEPKEALRCIKKRWRLVPRFKQKLPKVKHSFTRFRAELTPLVYRVTETPECTDYFWVSQTEIQRLPFSSGHRKILKILVDSLH